MSNTHGAPFFRDPNLSRFGAGYNKGFMAPNAGGALASLGNMITRTSKEATPAFSGGIIGRMGAITKLERRAARNASSKAVLRGDLNLARIAKMNGGPLSTQVYAPPGSRLPAVRNPATGKTVKVNFGDPNMRIKKSNPKRRKSFRARHNCSNPGPRTKARYWSCRKW
mgnify:CR=1 FL=1